MRSTSRSLDLDSYGQAAAALCALHCALMPLALGLLPTAAAESVEHAPAHALLLGLSVVLALAGLGPALRRHRDVRVAALALLGVGALVVAALAHEALGETFETAGTLLGGLLLTAAHRRNRALRHTHLDVGGAAAGQPGA